MLAGLCAPPPAADSDVPKQNKELKLKITELQHKLATVEAKLQGQEQLKDMAIQKAQFETKVLMQDAVNAAYDKGWTRCKESIEANMALLKSLRD